MTSNEEISWKEVETKMFALNVVRHFTDLADVVSFYKPSDNSYCMFRPWA